MNRKASRHRGIEASSGERQEENREWTRVVFRFQYSEFSQDGKKRKRPQITLII